MLKTCNDQHSICSRLSFYRDRRKYVVPTRLVYVGNDVPYAAPRLYNLTSAAQKPRAIDAAYVALSHCWGTSEMIKTTTATLEQYTRGIPWQELPQLFQDAITITRALGIDYLWIDSLCILQDSSTDWARESAQIGNIYSGALFTIGASLASNGDESLFNRHPVRKIQQTFGGTDSLLIARRPISHEIDASSDCTPKLPLRKRAWCLQEELLSPRFVHFTRDELVWVCHEGTNCECSPDTRPAALQNMWANAYDENRHTIWEQFIENYTKRAITYQQDRLPAISSASGLFGCDAGRYDAGLWESDMPGCLLWCVEERETSASTVGGSNSASPTWSWASTDFVVTDFLYESEDKMMAEVLEVETYPTTSDPRGLLSGGHITLKGAVISIEELTRHTGKEEVGIWNLPAWSHFDSSSGHGVALKEGAHLLVISKRLTTYHNVLRCRGLVIKRVTHPTDAQEATQTQTGSTHAWVRCGTVELAGGDLKSIDLKACTDIVTIF